MMRLFIAVLYLVVVGPLMATGDCCQQSCAGHKVVAVSQTKVTDTIDSKVDAILARLNQKSKEVKTYEATIRWLVMQPIVESQTLRTGKMYYFNSDKISKLRMNFDTLQQDNEPPQKYLDQYLFDGVTLTRIDYQLKTAELRQLAEANEPLNAFDLASRYLPIIGFANTDRLRKDFAISLVSDTNEITKLRLTTKPDSQFKDEYTFIDFWINSKTLLPIRMIAISEQQGINHDLQLTDPVINKELPADAFNVTVPVDFGKNVVPFEKVKR